MEDDLDAKIRELEKQLGDMPDDQHEQGAKNNKLFADIQDLQRQLADDQQTHIKSTKPNNPTRQKVSQKRPLPVQHRPKDSHKPSPKQFSNQSVSQNRQVLPPVEEVNTLLAIEQFIDLASKQKESSYLTDIVLRKQKYMNLINSGKIDHHFYVKGLNNKNIKELSNPMLATLIAKQQKLLSTFKTPEEFFEKIVDKMKQSLPGQLEKAGIHDTKLKQFKARVQFVPKSFSVNVQQKQLIQKINQQTIEKKLQLLLQGMSKLQSVIEYYKQNMPQKKTTELQTDLLPKRQYGFKLIHALQAKKNIPIGEFYILHIPKISFDSFHGSDRKQFISNVNLIVERLKGLQLAEKEFKKKIARSSKNSPLIAKIDQQMKIYEQDLQYLGSIRNRDFAPIPAIRVTTEDREYFAENTKLERNDLQLIIKHAEGFHGNVQLKIYFDQSDKPKSVFHIDSGVQNIDLILKVTQQGLKQLSNKSIRLKMQGTKMLMFTSDLMTASIDLKELEDKNSFDGIIITNNIKIAYEVNTRLPINKISKVKTEVMRLRRFPEYNHTKQFEMDFIRGILYPQTKKITHPSHSKPPSQPPIKHVEQSNHSQTTKTKSKLIYPHRNQQVIQKLRTPVSGILPQMLEQPEIYCDSLNYQTQMEHVLDKALNEIYQYKPNRKIVENIQDEIMKRRMTIESLSKAGKLTPDDYIHKLQKCLQSDQILLKTYSSLGLQQFSMFINARIDILTTEINQLKTVQSKPQSRPQQPHQTPSQPKSQLQKNQKSNPNVVDLSSFKLFFVRRNPEILNILQSLTSPIEYIQVQKIKKPQISSMSVKYLTQFELVLDSAINQYSIGDKLNKNLAENIQDDVMKLKMLSTKKKDSMTPEQYTQTIRGFIDFDQKLKGVYKKLKLPEFQKFLLARIKVYKLEIGEQPTLQIQKECTFDTGQTIPLFQLKKNPQSMTILSKYTTSIQHPQLPEFCPCVTYIQEMIQLSTNPEVKQRFELKKAEFEKNFSEGTFNQEEYMAKLKKCRQEDIQRLDIYKNNDLKDFYLFVKARINIIDGQLSNF